MSQSTMAPRVSLAAVVSAGLASAAAAAVTSVFGVAGTILGAALATMIITGASALLKAHLESAAGRARAVPRSLRSRIFGRDVSDPGSGSDSPPGRPDLRANLAGRMRAALGWFSSLPQSRRRPILIGGLLAAAVSFLIGMSAVTAAELVAGKSLSCAVWERCPAGRETNTLPSILGGGASFPGGGPPVGREQYS
jgi:hypothetical protein